MTESSTARIRELNDAFRKTFAGGKMVMSASVAALPEMVKASALVKVAEFTDFTLEDDPHGEHDFLSFEHCNRTFFLEMRLLQHGHGCWFRRSGRS
jgi:hypothetical protein